MDDRPIYFVIVYRTTSGRWLRYGSTEFAHRLSALKALGDLQRKAPKRVFSVRQKRWRGAVYQPSQPTA
jgi:hypothetical protein